MILSHHGEYEFGSPKLPMFREAVILHYLDDLDSKMGAIRATLGSDRGEQEWTDRSGALDRRLLRVEKYVRVTTPEQTVTVGQTVEQIPLIPPPQRDVKADRRNWRGAKLANALATNSVTISSPANPTHPAAPESGAASRGS